MTVLELTKVLNEQLKMLKGEKFNNASELHTLINNTLTKHISQYGMKVGVWSITLSNDFYSKVFRYHTDLRLDKRYKYDLKGSIDRAYVEPFNSDKKLASIEVLKLKEYFTEKAKEAGKEALTEKIQALKQEIKELEKELKEL